MWPQSVPAASYFCYHNHCHSPFQYHRNSHCQSSYLNYRIETSAHSQRPWSPGWDLLGKRSFVHGETQLHTFKCFPLGWSRYDTRGHLALSIQGQRAAYKYDQKNTKFGGNLIFSSVRAFPSIFLHFFGKKTYRCEPAQTCSVDLSAPWRSQNTQLECSSTIGNRYDCTTPGSHLQPGGIGHHSSTYTLDPGKSHPSTSKARAIPITRSVLHSALLSAHCPSFLYFWRAFWTWMGISYILFTVFPVAELVSFVQDQTSHPLLRCSRHRTLLLECPLCELL